MLLVAFAWLWPLPASCAAHPYLGLGEDDSTCTRLSTRPKGALAPSRRIQQFDISLSATHSLVNMAISMVISRKCAASVLLAISAVSKGLAWTRAIGVAKMVGIKHTAIVAYATCRWDKWAKIAVRR